RKFSKGEIIIREGDHGDEFFLIGQGLVEVHKRQDGAREAHLATLTGGDILDERSLMVGEPRNATCTAASDDVEVFILDKAAFHRSLESTPSFRDQIQSIFF